MMQLLLDITTDSETLMETVPFTYILQSISKDLYTQEKKFLTNDKKFDLHFKGLLENILGLLINLNHKVTDPKIKLRFKYWTSLFKINETLMKFLEKLLIKEKD